MTRTRSLAASLLSLSAAAALALVGTGTAAAAPSAPDDKSRASAASATVDNTGAADYWTADRMRAAIPGDVLAAKALERDNTSSAAPVEMGSNAKVKAQKGKPTIAQSEAPVDHIGKVFVTLGRSDYVCSGNAVESTNGSTVATAAHCLFDGANYPSRFMFVPGYDNGAAPYGKWTGTSYRVPDEWEASGNMKFDTGFAVVVPAIEGGPLLADAVNESAVEFGAGPGLTYKAYGYPAARSFKGETLMSCTGTATADLINPQFNTQGIPCDMTGGSSGGPWFNVETGRQNSINSYGYKGSDMMYGPQWGTEIKKAYNAAATVPLS